MQRRFRPQRQKQRANNLAFIVVSLLLFGAAIILLLMLLNRQEEELPPAPTAPPTEIVERGTPTQTPSETTIAPSPTPSMTLSPTPSLTPTGAPTIIPETPLPNLPPLPQAVDIALGIPIFGAGVDPNTGRMGGLYDNAQFIDAGHIFITVPGDDIDDTFHIDAFEVTNLQLVRYLNATNITATSLDEWGPNAAWLTTAFGDSPLAFQADEGWVVRSPRLDTLPVRGISGLLARAYCANLGGALPTLEQWERAAYWVKDAPPNRYPWGNAPPERALANFAGETVAPRESYVDGRSWVGAYHMAGNVAEWVLLDDDTFARVGGSFMDDAVQFLETFQVARVADPSIPIEDAGFRCVVR